MGARNISRIRGYDRGVTLLTEEMRRLTIKSGVPDVVLLPF